MDISLLKKHSVDYLFLPTHNQIYPKGPNTKIKLSPFSKQLCGKFRPGHFKSVADVKNNGLKVIGETTIEIDGEERPACIAETIGVIYC